MDIDLIAPGLDRLVDRDPPLDRIAHGLTFGEGPVWDKRTRQLYWVDIIGSTIWKWKPGVGREVVLKPSGHANGMTFDKEGIITLGCNLHQNMSAHIVVVSAPHYVITDDKGRFSFGSLEPGTYKLRAWSDKSLQPIVQEVVIKPERNVVTVKVKGDAPTGPLPDKFGVSRGAK